MIRLAIYIPVLFLIAVVVVGQQHVSARETIRDAVRRTGRWLGYTAAIVLAMVLIAQVFIG